MSKTTPTAFDIRKPELNGQIDECRRFITEHKEAIRNANVQITYLQEHAGKLQRELKDLNNAASKEPRVSDHALLRYCERVMGANLAEIRHALLIQTADKIGVLGSGSFPISTPYGKATAIVRESTIVTVLTNDSDDN